MTKTNQRTILYSTFFNRKFSTVLNHDNWHRNRLGVPLKKVRPQRPEMIVSTSLTPPR